MHCLTLSPIHSAPGAGAAVTKPELRHLTPDTRADTALVARFVNDGDETAFVEIVARHRARIFALACSHLRNPCDAEEITQDTFIRAHRALATFRGDASLATWLHRIALNLSRNRYWHGFRRRQQDSISIDQNVGTEGSGTLADVIADRAENPAQCTANRELSLLLERCMAGLEKRHRELLHLRANLNKTYEEIAVTLSMNVGTVKSSVFRARASLRALLAEMSPEFSLDSNPGEWLFGARSDARLGIARA